MNRVRAIILLVATIAALLLTPSKGSSVAVQPVSQASPTLTKGAVRDPLMMRMVNCEDYDIQPCYTYDDGAWRMVYSYMPYRAIKLHRCKEEDGGPKLPCIWKDKNRVTKGQPSTRNVFIKS